MGPPDRWADWLIRGRQRGFDEHQIRALTKALRRVRNRVLAGALLRKAVSVLDVGAGTGLLAVEARRRVGESGRVIALDISTDALAGCARPGIGLGPATAHGVTIDLAPRAAPRGRRWPVRSGVATELLNSPFPATICPRAKATVLLNETLARVTQLTGTLKWADGEGAHEEHLDLLIR